MSGVVGLIWASNSAPSLVKQIYAPLPRWKFVSSFVQCSSLSLSSSSLSSANPYFSSVLHPTRIVFFIFILPGTVSSSSLSHNPDFPFFFFRLGIQD
ncbi:unnamed protein product [Citrullus colocynthis]|uniref:Uncharacterized protein n=1 Tax=Citrullus colocynthis TaxID=252529 RepID=A0ABP0Y0Z7_9ROSI